MSSDRWQEVAPLVDRALRLSGPERARFVADRCAGDPELLVQVLDLLLATEEADALVTPVLAPPTPHDSVEAAEDDSDDAGPSPAAPAGFGAFEMVRELGQGGMGTVYLAQQTEPVRRRVAVKLAKAAMPSRRDRLRLEAERQALARLSHPNVAQLFEAGTTDSGHPYFAMEFVDGEPITSYCDRRRLGRRQRLELFLQVCAGVEHAHQKSVLHRDLKPSNVLVAETPEPTPKVIDFGIAKALDRPLVDATQLTGERMIGTPAYLSPEAVMSHPVDTRTDVYSLGVLLQELLIGERPFTSREELRDGLPLVELLRRVVHDDPEPPSRRWQTLSEETQDAVAHERGADPRTYGRGLRGDLDWIVGRALARDPEDRYASVGDLAADLRRHLADEPVLAGPPTTGYRLRKLVRRRRGPIVAAILLLLALAGGFVARSLEAERANREAARASERAEAARQAADEARAARDETEEVVDFLVGLFTEAEPGRTLGEEPSARELLRQASEDLLAGELDASTRVQARILATVAEVERKLGNFGHGVELAQRALELQRRELGDEDPATARARKRVGLMLVFLGRHDEAQVHLQQAHRLLRAVLDEDGGGTPLEPEARAEYRKQLVNTLQLLGIIESAAGRPNEALEFWVPELKLREQLVGPDDPVLTFTLQNLAIARIQLGELARGEELLRRALKQHEATKPADHPDVLVQRSSLAELLMRQARWHESKEMIDDVIAREERVLGPDHESVAKSLTIRGALLVNMGRWSDAETDLLRAHHIQSRALGEDHPWLAHIVRHRGWSRLARGLFDDAISLLRQALQLQLDSLGDDSPFAAETRVELATALRLAGRPEASVELLDAAEPILARSATAIPWVIYQLRVERAWIRLDRGDLDAAAELFEQAYEDAAVGELVRELAPIRGQAAWGLAELAARRGDADAATRWLQRARTSFDLTLPDDHVYRQRLAELESRLG